MKKLFQNKLIAFGVAAWTLSLRARRVLAGLKGDSGSNAAGIEMLTDRLASFRTNEAFLAEVAKGPGA